MQRFIFGCGALLLSLLPAAAQDRPAPDWLGKYVDHGARDARLKDYQTPEGLKLEIVADAPTVVNPIAMTFAPDGTLYVIEETATPPVKGDRVVTTHRIKVVRDRQGKGVYDESAAVLAEESPDAILFHDGYFYLCGQGLVRRYKYEPSAGPVGKAQVVVEGLGDVHHRRFCGLAIGNDGGLYITTDHEHAGLKGPDGSRAVALHTGALFRCRPDGAKIQVHSVGYHSPCREVAFDIGFNFFQASSGASGTGLVLHALEGADFGFRTRRSRLDALPPMQRTGPGAPLGLLIYNDTRLPEEYRGLIYYPDQARQSIGAYAVQQKGAAFQVTHEFKLLKSSDPLFRPAQVVSGPDGAIYICDARFDFAKPAPDAKGGRIYRLSWSGTKDIPAIALRGMDSWAKLQKQADAELLKSLESDDLSDRLTAQRELVRRGDKHRPALITLLKDLDRPIAARLAALGSLQSFWNAEVQATVIDQLGSSQPDLRRLAADALALHGTRGDRDIHEALVQILNDDDSLVRRSVYLAIGKIAGPTSADALVSALQFDDGKDRYLRDGLARGLEAVGKEGIDKLLALADSGPGKDLERVLDIYKNFRTRAAAEGLPTLLKNYHLKPAQKAALLRAYGNYQLDPPLSLQPLQDQLLLKAASMDEKTAAVEALGQHLEGALFVGQRFAAKELPAALQPEVVEALRRFAEENAEAQKLLRQITSKE